MSSIQMIVPVVFWGGKAPSHKITRTCKAGATGRIATGCESGEICLWKFQKENDELEVRYNTVNDIVM